MPEQKPETYCAYVKGLDKDNLHRKYHDTQYGFPIRSDNELFGRLVLEINQAGLSWATILKKQDGFRKAYSQFDIKKIANYKSKDIKRLLADANIIRNKLKVGAAIHNAQQIQLLQKEYGSFKKWLDIMHPLSREELVKLFKKTFKFTGGEITNEFLLSAGYLKGAHESSCPVFEEVRAKRPKWLKEV